MSVVIETLILCDECGDSGGGDDRNYKATKIRASRKLAGWIQIGHQDYCDKCAHQAKLKNSLINMSNHLIERHGHA